MTMPPSAPTSRVMRRRLAFAAIGLLVAVGVAVRMFWWPAIIDVPMLDLERVDPAVRRLLDERLAEVRKDPRSADAWGTLGIVLDNNLFEQAHACFAQAERLEPENPRWPHYQGIAYLRTDPAAALPKFQRAAQLAGEAGAPSRLRLAELDLQLGHFEEARAEFETLLKKDAHLPWAHLGLARLDFHEGKTDQARRHLRVPLAHPMTAKPALMLSAEMHARSGDAAAARQEHARSLEMPKAPDWPDPFVRATLQYQVGQAALVRKAETLCDLRRLSEAVQLLREIVRDYPDSRAGWTLLGWALMQHGRPAEAEQALHAALKIDANSATSLVYLGMIRFSAQDPVAAADYFRRARDKKPDSFEAHFNLGQCLKAQKDLPGAVAAVRKAVDCQPFNARAHALLGGLLLESQRPDEGVFHLQEALSLNPNLPETKQRLEEARKQQSEIRK